MPIRIVALFILAGLVIGRADARAPVFEKLPVLANTQHIEHQSDILGRSMQIFIKEPIGFEGGEEPLPVIYLLDADTLFPLLASYSWALSFSEEMPPVILVGIGYGSFDPTVNFRNRDYTAASDTRAEWGGAAQFLDMLEQELFPLVEGRVPVDPARRTLIGQSLGGQLVIYQALHRPGLTDLGIAVNPAIHHNTQSYIGWLADRPDLATRQSLYVSSAQNDLPVWRDPTLKWLSAAANSKPANWCLRAEQLDGHGHLTSTAAAFRSAMRWHLNSDRECDYIDPDLVR